MSTTSVGEIGLDLVVNQKQFHRQMSGIMGVAKKAGVALAAAFGVKKLADFSKQCLELGSDLAEVQNVVDVTFPAMTAQVDKFAKSAAQNFGLSETMAKRFTGTFGAMAKAIGFSEKEAYNMGTALTGLAGDVASFYNISQDEAYTKLKSVFTGETESLKDLGVVMTQAALDQYALANGYGKTTVAMSEAEKVALRYAFVQQQLSAASGDFIRTSDSWANQVRILKLQVDSLKATIGQGLINLFTPIIKVVNTVIGKLATLANAFKAFTELITGKKSSGGTSIANPVADLETAAGNAAGGLSSAGDAAKGLSGATKDVGKSAKKAAKEMRALMGFDQINRLDDNSSDTGDDASSPSTGSAGGAIGGAVDFGGLAQGETVIDKVDKSLSALIKRCKELAAIFKKGFRIGFGDSKKKIAAIQKSLESINESLKEILLDPDIVKAANKCADSIAEALGKITGSAVRIGLTIADNLVGGIAKYLQKSKNYIKDRLLSLLDISDEIAGLAGDFAVAIADIFDVFSGDDAKGITAAIIGIFTDGFFGVIELAGKFARDIFNIIVAPVTQNVEKIRTAFENTLAPIRVVLETLHLSVKQTFEKIFQVYDEYIKPFLDSVTSGISSIVSSFLEAYNTYIAPVLDTLGAKFTEVYVEHIQPMLDKLAELFGKVAENLQALWETALVPFIQWIIDNVMPVLGPILETLGTLILELLGTVGDVVGGIISILSGFMEFATGAFTGDFEKCFSGLDTILKGFQDAFNSVFSFIQNNILTPFDDWLSGVFEKDWTDSFGVLGNGLNAFFTSVENIWEDIKLVFSGVVDFINGVFSGNWQQAWEGIRDIFAGVFEGLADIARTPINAIIGAFNSVIDVVNGMIGKINSIRFTIDIPDWMGGGYWGFNGFNIPYLGKIPYLAQGGYVKPNTPQLAMIGDNRHQGEIVAPENKLEEMARKAAMAAGNGDMTKVLAVLEELLKILKDLPVVTLDPEALRKYFIEKTNERTRANGKPELLY